MVGSVFLLTTIYGQIQKKLHGSMQKKLLQQEFRYSSCGFSEKNGSF